LARSSCPYADSALTSSPILHSGFSIAFSEPRAPIAKPFPAFVPDLPPSSCTASEITVLCAQWILFPKRLSLSSTVPSHSLSSHSLHYTAALHCPTDWWSSENALSPSEKPEMVISATLLSSFFLPIYATPSWQVGAREMKYFGPSCRKKKSRTFLKMRQNGLKMRSMSLRSSYAKVTILHWRGCTSE